MKIVAALAKTMITTTTPARSNIASALMDVIDDPLFEEGADVVLIELLIPLAVLEEEVAPVAEVVAAVFVEFPTGAKSARAEPFHVGAAL